MTQTRAHRRLERPREQVLVAALEMIADQGLARVTMASLARRLGTSGGHLLYYFGTRNHLLLETLRWSEKGFADQRRPIVDSAEQQRKNQQGVEAMLAFAKVYLPVGDRDPRWLLWLELWARAPHDPELIAAQHGLDEEWHADLVRLLSSALPDLRDPQGTSTRLRAMWDGFAMAIVTGGGLATRGQALEHTRSLLAPQY